MKLKSPYFLENIWRDQPYSSMLLIAPSCDFACEGCQNIHLSKESSGNFSVESLIEIYNHNPFYKGITVGGLEPFLSGEEFLNDLLSFIVKAKIEKVTIYTRFTLADKNVDGFVEKLNKIPTISHLYLKTGKYKQSLANEKIVYIDSAKITLHSTNQAFVRVK